MYRVSATLIDSYLLYHTQDWFSYEMLESRIKGEFTYSRPAEIGTKFQALVEKIMERGWNSLDEFLFVNDEHKRYDLVNGKKFLAMDDFLFDIDSIKELFNILPFNAIPELKSIIKYKTNHGDVDLVCKADACFGLIGYDTKTSLKAMQPQKYTDSYQWRYYSVCFGFKKFIWPLVQFSEDKKNDNCFILRNITTANQTAYEFIEQDCLNKVNEFMSFCYDMNLLDHLIPWWEKDEK